MPVGLIKCDEQNYHCLSISGCDLRMTRTTFHLGNPQ